MFKTLPIYPTTMGPGLWYVADLAREIGTEKANQIWARQVCEGTALRTIQRIAIRATPQLLKD